MFPIKISSHYVVGIDREALLLGITLEDYCRRIVGFIKSSALSESLISSVLVILILLTIGHFLLLELKYHHKARCHIMAMKCTKGNIIILSKLNQRIYNGNC